MLNGPTIREGDAESLLSLSDQMYRCEVTFNNWEQSWLLDSPDSMHGLFAQMPYRIKSQFVSGFATGVKFRDLRLLVEKAAAEAGSEYGMLLYQRSKTGDKFKGSLNKAEAKNKNACFAQRATFLALQSASSPNVLYACSVCNGSHKIWKCPRFKDMTVEERDVYVRKNGLCFNCLLSGHKVSNCNVKVSCRKCNKKHNTLLHIEGSAFSGSSTSTHSSEQNESVLAPVASCAASSSKMSGKAFFKVVPVKVWANNVDKFVYTYAFIDEGSNVNMCSQRLVEDLNLPVSYTNVELITSGSTAIMHKRVGSLGIQGINESSAFSIQNAFVVDEVVDVSSSIPTPEIVQAYPHLRELDFSF